MVEEFYNKHYISVDDKSRILDAWSDGPHPEKNAANAICINERGGYQFRLILGGEQTEENPPLRTMDGIPLYRWDGTRVLPRGGEEIGAERAAIPEPPPSEQEQLRADVDFLFAMGGLL